LSSNFNSGAALFLARTADLAIFTCSGVCCKVGILGRIPNKPYTKDHRHSLLLKYAPFYETGEVTGSHGTAFTGSPSENKEQLKFMNYYTNTGPLNMHGVAIPGAEDIFVRIPSDGHRIIDDQKAPDIARDISSHYINYLTSD
jgi:hypothetical protein